MLDKIRPLVISAEEQVALLRLLDAHAVAREAESLIEVADELQAADEAYEALSPVRDRLRKAVGRDL